MSVVWHCRVLDHPEIAGEAVVHDEDDEDDDGSGPMNDEQVPDRFVHEWKLPGEVLFVECSRSGGFEAPDLWRVKRISGTGAMGVFLGALVSEREARLEIEGARALGTWAEPRREDARLVSGTCGGCGRGLRVNTMARRVAHEAPACEGYRVEEPWTRLAEFGAAEASGR